MKIYRNLFSLIRIPILFSAAFITVFALYFQYPYYYVIPLHLMMVLAFFCILTLFCGSLLCFTFLRKNVTPYIIAFIFASGFIVLISLYIGCIVSNTLWGNNLTMSIIISFYPRLHSLLEIGVGSTTWIYLGIIIFIVTILLFYLSRASFFYRNLQELFFTREYSLFKDFSAGIKSLSMIIICILLFSCFLYLSFNSLRWKGEPVASLFMRSLKTLWCDPVRLKVAEQDRFIRKNYPKHVDFDKKNVVIIMADSIRADHLKFYGYKRDTTPFLSHLKQEGKLKVVDLSLSTCSNSFGGILSTLSSKNYSNLSYYNYKLYDLLHDQGYKTYMLVSGDHEGFGLKEIYGNEIDFYYDHHSSDDKMILEGLNKVPSYQGTPSFFYFFLMSSHMAGVKYESSNLFQPSTFTYNRKAFLSGEVDREVAVNRYDNGIVQADAFIKKIFFTLEQKGYLQNSIVFILSDHGEGLGEHDHFSHGWYLYQENIKIPMLIYDTSTNSYDNLSFATQLDVAPTILDRLKLPVPQCWEGKSLLTRDVQNYSYHTNTQFENGELRLAMLHKKDGKIYKYIYSQSSKKQELYELNSDPLEQNNIIAETKTEFIKNMRAQLAQMFRFSID